MKKVILVRNKSGGYPSSWGLLMCANGKYWLGGSSASAIVAKNSDDVKRIIKEVRGKMRKFNLQYKSIPIIDRETFVFGGLDE